MKTGAERMLACNGKVIWKILHEGVRYIEYGEQGSPKAQRKRLQRMARRLRQLGWTVTPPAQAHTPTLA